MNSVKELLSVIVIWSDGYQNKCLYMQRSLKWIEANDSLRKWKMVESNTHANSVGLRLYSLLMHHLMAYRKKTHHTLARSCSNLVTAQLKTKQLKLSLYCQSGNTFLHTRTSILGLDTFMSCLLLNCYCNQTRYICNTSVVKRLWFLINIRVSVTVLGTQLNLDVAWDLPRSPCYTTLTRCRAFVTPVF